VISFGWVRTGWIVDVHRIAAWALLALVPFKIGIAWRSLKRGPGRRLDRNVVMLVSLVLATLAISVLALALLWTWRIDLPLIRLPGFLLWWHWILAFVLLIPLGVHVWRRWPRPKARDIASRRGMLRAAGLGTAGLIGWIVAEALSEARTSPDEPRRVTGSRRLSAFSGNDFPITGEYSPTIDRATWTLAVGGAVESSFSLSFDDLLTLSASQRQATLDCTNGWWTVQDWTGVLLSDLLAQARPHSNALAVRLKSVTGYGQVFSLKEAQLILIATHVGGEALSHWHGAPARAVVSTRRGWFWVKWLSAVEVLDTVAGVLEQPFSIR